MKKLALLSILGFAACGGNKFDDAIKKTEDFKSKMCDCKDIKCADDVHKDYKAFEKELQSKFTEDDLKNLNGDQIKKLMETEEAMKDCRRKLRDAK